MKLLCMKISLLFNVQSLVYWAYSSYENIYIISADSWRLYKGGMLLYICFLAFWTRILKSLFIWFVFLSSSHKYFSNTIKFTNVIQVYYSIFFLLKMVCNSVQRETKYLNTLRSVEGNILKRILKYLYCTKSNEINLRNSVY